jgi:hypothetical protein
MPLTDASSGGDEVAVDDVEHGATVSGAGWDENEVTDEGTLAEATSEARGLREA